MEKTAKISVKDVTDKSVMVADITNNGKYVYNEIVNKGKHHCIQPTPYCEARHLSFEELCTLGEGTHTFTFVENLPDHIHRCKSCPEPTDENQQKE